MGVLSIPIVVQCSPGDSVPIDYNFSSAELHNTALIITHIYIAVGGGLAGLRGAELLLPLRDLPGHYDRGGRAQLLQGHEHHQVRYVGWYGTVWCRIYLRVHSRVGFRKPEYCRIV